MDPVTLVAAVGTGVSTANKAVSLFRDIKSLFSEGKQEEALGPINDAEQKVSDLLTALMDIQVNALQLQEDNRRLNEELRTQADWNERLKEYVKVQTEGGGVVYKHIGDIGEYVCPVCIETRNGMFPLQDQNTVGGNSQCPACKAMYNTRKRVGISGAKLL